MRPSSSSCDNGGAHAHGRGCKPRLKWSPDLSWDQQRSFVRPKWAGLDEMEAEDRGNRKRRRRSDLIDSSVRNRSDISSFLSEELFAYFCVWSIYPQLFQFHVTIQSVKMKLLSSICFKNLSLKQDLLWRCRAEEGSLPKFVPLCFSLHCTFHCQPSPQYSHR